jgi:hypothetical protein
MRKPYADALVILAAMSLGARGRGASSARRDSLILRERANHIHLFAYLHHAIDYH